MQPKLIPSKVVNANRPAMRHDNSVRRQYARGNGKMKNKTQVYNRAQPGPTSSIVTLRGKEKGSA